IPIGLILGFGSVIVVKSLMPQEAFTAWGWRILFVLGFLVAIVGVFIRRRTEDSFVFERHRRREDVLQYPATQVWRDMPLVILRASLVNAMFGGAFFLYFVFGTSYMKAVGFAGSEPEQIGLIAAAFMLVFMIIGSWLADLIGRRAVLLIAAVGEVIGFGFVFGFGYGAIPAFYTEIFPTRYRASGASAGYQIAQVYGGGLIPILAGLVLKAVGIHQAYLYIGGLVMVYAVLAIFAIVTTAETRKVDLEGIMTPSPRA